MKKDTIYIDIEDDITAVIERVKGSPEKLIALVPPKGNAVLQSVVNLKLLKRAADGVSKQLVVVTSNQALTALAGGLGYYIAKNLQSKPSLLSDSKAELPEDEIEMSDEVGELDQTGQSVSLNDVNDDDSDEVEISQEDIDVLSDDEVSEKVAKDDKSKKAKKIPNFDNFRKKLLIGGGIALLLLIVLIFVFGRAKAKIVIKAQTTPVDVAIDANFSSANSQSDPSSNNLKATLQESKKTISQSFSATGQKDLGTKANGTVKFINCSKDDKLSDTNRTIPAGTGISASGKTFITSEAVTVQPSSYVGNACLSNKESSSVGVEAQSVGDSFNLSSRSYSVNGFATVTGSGSQMSGGTSKIVKVVAQSDIDKAREQLNQQDTSAIKDELKKSFSEDTTILNDTFSTTFGNVVSEPAVDQEANEGKLTAEVTYSILGVSNKDIGASLDAFITSKMTNKDQQRVYDNGLKDMKLEKISGDAKSAVYKISTLAFYGPQFDTEKLRSEVAGKKYGEMRSYLQDLPGVKSVDIKLSPFWARKAPGADRIKITLDVDKNSTSN